MKEFFRENWPPILLLVAILLTLFNASRVSEKDHIAEPGKMVIDAEQDRMICNMDARLRKLESNPK